MGKIEPSKGVIRQQQPLSQWSVKGSLLRAGWLCELSTETAPKGEGREKERDD